MNLFPQAEFPTADDIVLAKNRISPYIHKTPVHVSKLINELCQAEVFFKCENFQKVGAFKSRGACNAVFSLTEEQLQNGVGTHSSGNHAQALARAATLRNTKAYIVMPENAPTVKVNAVKQYGGIITFCKPTLQDRENTLEKIKQEKCITEIHPYNNLQVITGQATACLELIEEIPQMDFIITPVGGGGLLSGTALAAHYFSPQTTVLAGEPLGAADAAASLQKGEIVPSINPKTIADGLLTSLGTFTFPIIREHVKRIITISDEEILFALKLIWERLKVVVEPSAAVPLAALLQQKDLFKGSRTGIILSGGNIELTKLASYFSQ